MTETERRCLQDVRAMGRSRIGSEFDVEEISVETIFLRHQKGVDTIVRVPLTAELGQYGDGLLVGAVSLPQLYSFLKGYQDATRDLDRLYARNVRQFLGSKRKINKGIQTTLIKSPERFGLYNNGITIVVDSFERSQSTEWLLSEPYVVNGCQTTRSLWEVLQSKLEAGGNGSDPVFDTWRTRLERGVVVLKVVRVGPGADAQIADITRFTNSQNAVREKDFIALESDFQQWQNSMAVGHGIYLEIQRGGWDSRRAWQKQNPLAQQFRLAANAFDLIKVYGAGWMGEPGTAYGRNQAFVPDGTIFRRIIEPDKLTGDSFGLDDLYAAWLLHATADRFAFGRGATVPARRQSRYLYYFVLIELLKDLLRFAGIPTPSRRQITGAVLRLVGGVHDPVWREVAEEAVAVIDEYLTHGGDDTAFNEPAFINTFNNDLNSYLKWEALGKNEESSPCLRTLIALARKALGKAAGHGGGVSSVRDLVKRALV